MASDVEGSNESSPIFPRAHPLHHKSSSAVMHFGVPTGLLAADPAQGRNAVLIWTPSAPRASAAAMQRASAIPPCALHGSERRFCYLQIANRRWWYDDFNQSGRHVIDEA
jgi:hypothetical protein